MKPFDVRKNLVMPALLFGMLSLGSVSAWATAPLAVGTTPSPTNMGSTAVGSTSTTQTITFTFTAGTGTLKAPVVLTRGATGLDFANANTGTCNTTTTYSSAGTNSCTVTVSFAPAAPGGLQLGAVELFDSLNNLISTAYLYGVGTGGGISYTAGETPTTAATATNSGGIDLENVVQDKSGNLYAGSQTRSQIYEFGPTCNSSSCATIFPATASFIAPGDLAVDGAGNIWMTDNTVNGVRKFAPGCVTTTCMTQVISGYPDSGIYGLALDGAGGVYVGFDDTNATPNVFSVKYFNTSTCTTYSCGTLMGGGYNFPGSLTLDGLGNLYVVDALNAVIQKMTAGASGCHLSSCMTPLGSGLLTGPFEAAIDGSGTLFVTDQGDFSNNYVGRAIKALTCNPTCTSTTIGSPSLVPTGISLIGNRVYYTESNANAGSDTTSAIRFFTSTASAPTVTSVSPTSGSTAGGNSVVITGTGFTGTTGTAGVKFGSTNASSYTVDSNTQITATAPAGSAGTVDVTVTNGGNTSATTAADHYTYASPSPVLGLTIAHTGNATQGQSNFTFTITPNVTVAATSSATLTVNVSLPTGMTLSSVTSGSTWSCNSSTSSHVVCTSTTPIAVGNGPAITAGVTIASGATSPLNISGTISGGGAASSANSNTDSVTVLQVTTHFSVTAPSTATTGTQFTTLTVTALDGANQTVTGYTGVVHFTSSDGSAVLPINANLSSGVGTFAATFNTAGPQTITATDNVTTSIKGDSNTVTVSAPPTVTSINPTAGPTAGGISVVITGTSFTGTTGVGGVKFGSVNASSYLVNSATQITASAPAGSAGTVHVTVTNGVTSGTTAADQFTYVAAPTVTGINPVRGATAGGTSVTITGTNLSNATSITIGGIAAGSVVCTSTSCTASTAAHAAGAVDVAVTTAGGTGPLVNGYTYIAPVTVVPTPSATTKVGATYSQTNVASGGVPSYTYALNAGAFVPGTTVDTSTGTVSGTPTITGTFSYIVQATDSAGDPIGTSGVTTAVIAKGDQTISLTNPGSHRLDQTPVAITASVNSSLTLSFASTTTSVCTVSGSSVTLLTTGNCTITADQAGDSNWNVATQQSATFAVTAPLPTVTGVSPSTGLTNATATVTITGTGFNTTPASNTVFFGSNTATPQSVNGTGTSMTVSAPTGAAGAVDVTVTTTGGTSVTSANDRYTYATPSAVTSSVAFTGSPLAVSASGTMTISLTNPNPVDTAAFSTTLSFDHTITSRILAAPGGTCTLGGASFPTADTVQFTNITVPANGSCTITLGFQGVKGGSETFSITAFTPTGLPQTVAASSSAVLVTPSITSLSVAQGSTAGGTSTVITGAGFDTNTANDTVKFGTATAAVTGATTTTLTVTTPAVTAGQVDVTVTVGGQTSATGAGDKFTFVTPPTVTSIAPTAGPLAGATPVTITGTGFSTANATGAVKFGTTVATYTIVSNTQIMATAPAGTAGAVDVTVTNPGGTSPTSGADQYTYTAVPTVTAISPTAGPLAGGTLVTITGTGFAAAASTGAVKFGAATAVYIIVNNTQITATAPAGSAGAVDVTVTTAGGTSTTGAADQYTYTAVPTVTAISPTSGPLTAGTSVTITGTGFSSANATGAVKFGTSVATYSIVSNTQITATAPAGSAGVVDVTVTTPGGTTATGTADQYTYTAVPTVTALSPSAGPIAGGTTVTITGTGFSSANATGAVKFGTSVATYTIVSNTQITATTPAETAATVDVTVTNPGGTSTTSAADQFIYTPLPTVASLSPAGGAPAGGTTVTITGTGFSSAASTGAVKFGTSVATYTIVSNTQITATTPAETASTVDVTVTNPGGTSTTSAADQFTFASALTSAISFTPTSLTAGGTSGSVTMTFVNPNPIASPAFSATLTFDHTVTSVAAVTPTGTCTGETVTRPTSDTITFSNITVPSVGCTIVLSSAFTPVKGGTETVSLSAFTPTGWPQTPLANSSTVTVSPTVTAINPTAGPLTAGTSVTITGTGFDTTGSNNTVKFGTAAATVTTATTSSLTVTAPAGTAGAVDVTVAVGGVTSATSAADQFTYTNLPTVTAIAPVSGPLTAGTSVTITGTHLTGATAVKFGTTAATGVTVVSDTQITVSAPAGSAGAVDVTVTTVGGTSATSAADQFTYIALPTVTAVSPNAGPASGGTTVTITGTNLTGATAVKFGTVNATSMTVNSATSITATAPAESAGAVDITVTTVGGTSTTGAADQYTFVALSAVTSVSPVTGSTNGGTVVTITGTHFTGASAVKFGAANAATFTVNSDTSISATTPASSAGAVNITVTTTGGTSATGSTNGFTFIAPPAPAQTNVAVNASSSTASTLHLTAGAANGPFTGISVTTPPNSGTVVVHGLDVIYVPDPTITTVTTVTFTVVIKSPYGTSAPITVTVTVTPGTQNVTELVRPKSWRPPLVMRGRESDNREVVSAGGAA